MSTAAQPSPSKRATHEVLPEPVQPLDTRGSFQRAASTEWQASIIHSAMQARQAVQRGQLGMPPTTSSNRRQLSATQSAPVLSFSQPAPFRTTNETLEAIYAGSRSNELQPMAATLYTDQEERSRRALSQQRSLTGSGLFSTTTDGGYQTRETTEEVMEDGGDGDGFDMDEVFGESTIQFPAPSQSSSFGDLGDSQTSTGTDRTITKGLKRAFEDGKEDGAAEEDDEMATTDVEDEGQEDVATAMAPFNAPMGRKLVARRGLSKTQSLPASAFSGGVGF